MSSFLGEDLEMEIEMSNINIPSPNPTQTQSPIHPQNIPRFEGPDLTLEDEERILESDDDNPPSHNTTPTTISRAQHFFPNIVVLPDQPPLPLTTAAITNNTTPDNTELTITTPTSSTPNGTTPNITIPNIPSPPTPTSSHPTPVPSTTNATTTSTINTTQSSFEKLVSLNRTKHNHSHHITILCNHLKNDTTPADLHITTQPWIQLSQPHQLAWDTGIKQCTQNFITTLISHHQEQLEKVDQQIQQVSSALHHQSPEAATTLINVASSITPQSRRKRPHSKPPRKPTTKTHKTTPPTHTITTPTNTHSTHQPKPHTSQFPITPKSTIKRSYPKPSKTPTIKKNHKTITSTHTITTPTTMSNINQPTPISSKDFRVWPHPPPNTKPQHPIPTTHTPQHPHPVHIHPNPLSHLMGNKSKFPIIYNMFMRGKR